MLEEERLSSGLRHRIKVEIDIFFPANPDFHWANQCVRWRLGRRHRIARQPIGCLHISTDAQHFDLPLVFVDRPMLRSETVCDGGASAEMFQGHSRVAGEYAEL